MIRFSLIVPTIGRPGLLPLLQSLGPAGLTQDDELVLIEDDCDVSEVLSRANVQCSVLRVRLSPRQGVWGQPGRNAGVAVAHGTHLAFAQDDNVLEQDGFARARAIISADPSIPRCFMVEPRPGMIEPQTWPPVRGMIDGDCVIVPARMLTGPRWALEYTGDFDWVNAIFQLSAGTMVWHSNVRLATHRSQT